MNSGIVAFLLGIAALVGAWFFGKSKGKEETKVKLSKEIATEKAKTEQEKFEKEIAQYVAKTTVDTVNEESYIQKQEDTLMTELLVAKEKGNEADLFEIANKLAEIARNRRGQ